MSDFTAYGYQILEQLGRNTYGGRVTYKAINLNDRQPVVIKQFQFARDSNWDDYKAIEQEINTLKTLNHPGIPRYLAHFDPGDGICLVQEYKDARSLSLQVNYDPDRIQRITISILEILVYLQNLIPPLIHRDLKPENILVDDRLNVSIDTSKLKADSLYERWLLLQTNTTPNNYTIKLRVKTPSLPEQIGKLPYFFLFLPLIIAFATTILLGIVVIFYSNVLVSVFQVSSISTVIGILIALFFFGIFGGSVILFCGALAGFLLDVLFDSTQEQKWHKYRTKIGTALGIIGGIFLGVVFLLILLI